jgi:hypothetical protein
MNDQTSSFTADEIRKIAEESCINEEATEFCIKMIVGERLSICRDDDRLRKILKMVNNATYRKYYGCPLSVYFPRSFFSGGGP